MIRLLNSIKIEYLIYLVLILVFLSYSYVNFLFVEDSVVYFNRSNYLSANMFFYYNGHIQIFPQLISFLVSYFSPVLQVIFYSLYSFTCFIFFIYILNKLVADKKVLFLFVCYICSFFTVLIYNLANTNWTGLLITALYPILIFRSNNNISIIQFLILLFFSLSNLLSILTIPIYLFCFYLSKFKDIKIIFIIFWIIFFSFAMINFSSDRSDLLQNLNNNFVYIFSNFFSFFIPNINLISDIPSRITELSSFIGLIVLFFVIYKSNFDKILKFEFISLLIFSFSILLLAFLSREVNSFYVGPRYFLAIVVIFFIYVSYYTYKLKYFLLIMCIFSFLTIPLTIYKRHFENFNNETDFFKYLLKGKKVNHIINRDEHWDIILMNLNIQTDLCTKNIKEENIDERIIFCSDNDGYILKNSIIKN